MAHLFDTGYCVREPAWHGLADVYDDAPADWNEFRLRSGLTWDPELRPLYGDAGIDQNGDVIYVQEPNMHKVVRSDTNARLGLAVTDQYHIIDHDSMGEAANILLEDKDTEIFTGGSLKGGEIVWALFKIAEGYRIGKDPSETVPFVGLINSHNGDNALTAVATSIRIVCWNTASAAMADAERTGNIGSIKHTAAWRDKLDELKLALAGAREDADEYREWAEHLATVTVTDDKFEEFIAAHFYPADLERATDQVRRNIDERAAGLRAMYRSSTCDGVRGTAYGVMNAITEYMDYGRGVGINDPDKARDRKTNRSLLTAEPFKRVSMERLGDVLGLELVKKKLTVVGGR